MPRPRIIIIEDDESQSKPFSQMLEYRGYDVRCAKDWPEANEIIQSFRPTLAIVDLLLISAEGSSGFDVIQKLRASAHSRVGILAWTARYVDARDEILALRAGADDFVRKDAEVGLIEARIDALVRRVRRRT